MDVSPGVIVTVCPKADTSIFPVRQLTVKELSLANTLNDVPRIWISPLGVEIVKVLPLAISKIA